MWRARDIPDNPILSSGCKAEGPLDIRAELCEHIGDESNGGIAGSLYGGVVGFFGEVVQFGVA